MTAHIDAPVTDDRAATSPLQQYQDHLQAGEFRYQCNPAFGRAFFPPRVCCPFTGSSDLEWRKASGLGRVYASTVVHPRDGEDYNVCVVECDEGFRLMTQVVGVEPQSVRIGMRVRVQIRPGTDGQAPYPVFVPAEGVS